MTNKFNTSKIEPKVVVAVILLVLILGGLVVIGEKEVHYHAGFKIYRYNQPVDFRAPEFMHFEPCGDEDKHKDKNPQDRAHLHDGIGDVVHVHSHNATWEDLLTTLNTTIDGQAKYYLNADQVGTLRQAVIQPYDRMLILIGENTEVEEKLESVPDREKIEQAEQQTEGC